MTTPTYAEFTDRRLAAIYDTIGPLSANKDFYLRLAAKLSARTVIDLGCGTGLLTIEFAQAGYHAIGLDPAPLMLEQARRRLAGHDATLIVGGAEKLGHPKADLAVMTGHVAQFFLDDAEWQTALHHIHDALAPGGVLAFESRNPLIKPFTNWPMATAPERLEDPKAGPLDWWYKPLGWNGNRHSYELHYRFIRTGETLVSLNELIFRSRADITASFESAGFTVEHVYGHWDPRPFTNKDEEMIFVARRV